MFSFLNRRATILPSTLTFALLCNAGVLSAQSPEGWPFEDKELNPSPPASQAPTTPASKSPVQQKLEELYRRDGRPLPAYMRKDGSPAFVQPTAQQQPAPLPRRPAQPPEPLVSPAPIEAGRMAPPQGSISQQLSDYYASQGKTMPGAQPSWNAAEPPRQTIIINAGQTNQYGDTVQPAPKPRLIDRLNPFHDFWHKDDAPKAPPTVVIYESTPSKPVVRPSSGYPSSQPVVAPAQPRIVYRTTSAPGYVMKVELGPSAPIDSISPRVRESAQPAFTSASPNASGQPVSAPAKSYVATTRDNPPAAKPAAEPATVVTAPSAPPEAPAPLVTAASTPESGVTIVRHGRPSSDAQAETSPDKSGAPYTGVKLQDTNEAVYAPDPTRVTTATANAPDDHPGHATLPAVDVEQPARESTQPDDAAADHSPPATHPQSPSAAVVVKTPIKQPSIAEHAAPKAFDVRQPATELPAAQQQSVAQMHKIGERVGQRGLKGFCPVALRERRELVDALPIYSSTFESRRYYFSSLEAQSRFNCDPKKYAPAACGMDVVVKVNSDQIVEGTLDFAVWYKDRLFLFSSPESLDAFSQNPASYAGHWLKAE